MASCTGIAVKEITGSRVYLKGSITGLSSSKEYCLHYFSRGYENLPNNSLDYTYIHGHTSCDLSAYGCYVPTGNLAVGGQFEVWIHEVSGNCETIVTGVCSKTLQSETLETVLVDIRVTDQFNDAVVGAQVNIPTAEGAKTISTDIYGVADGFTLESGVSHNATVTYAPNGYSITNTPSIRIVPYGNSSYTIYDGVKKDECAYGETQTRECWDGSAITTFRCVNGKWIPTSEQCPVEEETYSLTCYVKDEHGNGIPNIYVDCYVDNGRTDANGYIRFTGLEYGNYVVRVVPNNLVCISPPDCAYSFTLNANITRTFTLKEETTICNTPTCNMTVN